MVETIVDIEKMYNICVNVAKNESIIFYGDLGRELGVNVTHRNELGIPLDKMNIKEKVRDEKAPMLSAVVVHKSDTKFGGNTLRMPGDGFFILSKEWGLQKKGESNKEFFGKELKRVYEYWGARK